MKAIIDFSEIHSLIKSKTGREVVLSAISERTVRTEAKMSVKVPFIGKIEKTIGVEVTMERIDGQDVYLRYDSGMGTDMIIGGVLTLDLIRPFLRSA